jgi:hypothetical protein
LPKSARWFINTASSIGKKMATGSESKPNLSVTSSELHMPASRNMSS